MKMTNANIKKYALSASGIVAAAGIVLSLTAQPIRTAEESNLNPVIVQLLKEAKNHTKKGRFEKAANLLKRHATIEHPVIMLEYARMLARGKGVPQDLEEARKLLLLAVQQEFPKRAYAAFELAWVYERSTGEDCTRIAFEWYTKAANWGFVKAHVELGRMYARGIGVPQNMQLALAQFELGARHGSARSLLKFVTLVDAQDENQTGLPTTHELMARTIPQLEQEAFSGNAASAKALGRLYLEAKLVEADLAKAELWLRRSVRLGDVGAMPELANLLLQKPPTKARMKQAVELLNAAVALQHSGAMTDLGRLHLDPAFKLRKSDAVNLFEQAATAKHAGGMLELARLLFAGDLVTKDEKRAVVLLKKAAATGHNGSVALFKKLKSKGGELPKSDFAAKKLTRLSPAAQNETAAKIEIIKWEDRSTRTGVDLNTPAQTSPVTGATFVSRIEKRG